jgi:probable F420-dependent oxidoreductase
VARSAEQAGVDRLVVPDHVVFGDQLDAFGHPEVGGMAGGVQPTDPDGHWLEPLSVLAAVAVATSTARLATSVILAALRRPVVLAKTASTVDVLCGGRLELGVGVGWQEAEYRAAGLDFAQRGRLLDHTLEVCHELWSEQRASYSSDELRFDGMHMCPKPVQAGGVPVWVSGTLNPPVVRRLARFGAGWLPWGPERDDLVAAIERMHRLVEAEGRDPSDIGVVAFVDACTDAGGRLDLGATFASAPALTAAGATDVRVRGLRIPRDDDAASAFLVELVDAFRHHVG